MTIGSSLSRACRAAASARGSSEPAPSPSTATATPTWQKTRSVPKLTSNGVSSASITVRARSMPGARVAVRDQREVARAEVAEVVFGCQLAEPVRDLAKQFLDAGCAVDLGDAAELNDLHQDRGDLGVARLRSGSAGERANEALLVDREVRQSGDGVVQRAAAQLVEHEREMDQVAGVHLQRTSRRR